MKNTRCVPCPNCSGNIRVNKALRIGKVVGCQHCGKRLRQRASSQSVAKIRHADYPIAAPFVPTSNRIPGFLAAAVAVAFFVGGVGFVAGAIAFGLGSFSDQGRITAAMESTPIPLRNDSSKNSESTPAGSAHLAKSTARVPKQNTTTASPLPAASNSNKPKMDSDTIPTNALKLRFVSLDNLRTKKDELPNRSVRSGKNQNIVSAIAKGVVFLKKTQGRNGCWGNGSHAVGYASFAGLALLECGVLSKDHAVQSAAQFVRMHLSELRSTYELSLAILFLGRLGEGRDAALIESLALRLIAGQNANGGWTYKCPVLTRQEHDKLITFLKTKQPRRVDIPLTSKDFPHLIPLTERQKRRLTIPLTEQPGTTPIVAIVTGLPNSANLAVKERGPATEPPNESGEQTVPNQAGGGNVSNFPMLHQAQGAPQSIRGGQPSPFSGPPWRRPGFPNGRGKGRAASRQFESTPFVRHALPHIQDWKWRKGNNRDDNSNTQFAILALWAARRHGIPMNLPLSLLDKRFRSSQYPDGRWGYRCGQGGPRATMTCVGLLGLGVGHGNFRDTWTGTVNSNANAKFNPRQDPAIQNGLRALGIYLNKNSDNDDGNGRTNLYLLWSVERVAAMYNLQTIGNRDWYRWGAKMLLDRQEENGGWHTRSFSGSSPTIDTSMALLILCRSNLVQDLTDNLRPFLAVVDSE